MGEEDGGRSKRSQNIPGEISTAMELRMCVYKQITQ